MKPARIAIIAGMIARITWVVWGPSLVILDADGYRTLAHSLAAGHGYSSSAGPSAFWMPAWPSWMAMLYGLGATDFGVATANVVLGAATIATTWALARELCPDRPRVAWLAASVCALTPSLVLLPGLLLSENLAVLLVTLATLALAIAHRTRLLRHWALFGVVSAAATFTRESCAAIVLAGLVCSAFTRARGITRLLASITLVSAFAIPMTPWILRNRETLGVTTLTTSAGINLCVGFGEGATGGYRTIPTGTDSPLAAGEVERHRSGLVCAKEGIEHHPLAPVTLVPAKLSRLVVWDDWIVDDFLARSEVRATALRWAARALCDGFYWLLCLGAVAAVWRSSRAASIYVPGVVIVACAVPVLATFGAARFHTPLLPLLALLAARGWCYRHGS